MSESFDAREPSPGDPEPKRARRRRRRGLGVIGWLIIAVALVIVAGTAVLGWLAYSFQVESTRRAAMDQGLVPVTRDFAPGQPKPSDVLLRIAGSEAMTETLVPDLAAAFMRGQGFSGVTITKSGQVTTVVGTKDGARGRILVVAGTAKGGFEAMIERRVEAVASLRPIDTDEADRLSAFGDMTSSANERVIGILPEVVIVNRSNPVDAIGTDTLGRILSGEITDWSEVTREKEGPIQVKIETGRWDGTAPQELLGDREAPATVQRLATPQAVIDAVSRAPGSIGIALRTGDVSGVKPLQVSERNARLVAPDDLSLATEAYAFSRRARIYVGSNGGDPAARALAEFLLTPTGQTIVRRTGFVAPPLEAIQITPPADAPQAYVNFARDARRMNFDLRFLLGSSELDSKGTTDLGRFVRYAQANQIDPRRIALLGFADNVGARVTNVGLAQARAETVAGVLRQAGLGVGMVRAYGEQMPVGANAVESGRIRNRRVEVWICAPPACPLIDLAAQGGQSAAQMPARGVPVGVRLGAPPATATGDEAPKG